MKKTIPFGRKLGYFKNKQRDFMFTLFDEKPAIIELSPIRSQRYIIEGTPIALQRARLSQHSVWDPQKQEKVLTSISLESQHNNQSLFEGPLHIDFLFYFAIPKGSSKKKRLSLQGYPHVFKPDIDNCIKFYCDVSSDLLYHDDCIISSLSAKKLYDKTARVEMIITELR